VLAASAWALSKDRSSPTRVAVGETAAECACHLPPVDRAGTRVVSPVLYLPRSTFDHDAAVTAPARCPLSNLTPGPPVRTTGEGLLSLGADLGRVDLALIVHKVL
jgi:hypothetical protein